MSFSYQVHFCNDFLFSYDRFIVRPRFPRLTASLLGCPFIAGVYSWASLRECYGNGLTRRQHANFSLCHSFRTASMTAVCRGDKGGLVEKQSGIQHSMSFSSPTVKGRGIESCLLIGNPLRVRRKCRADDKHLSVPSDTHLLHGLAVPAFLYSSLGVFLFSMPFLYSLFDIQNSRFLRHCQEEGQATWLQSDP